MTVQEARELTARRLLRDAQIAARLGYSHTAQSLARAGHALRRENRDEA